MKYFAIDGGNYNVKKTKRNLAEFLIKKILIEIKNWIHGLLKCENSFSHCLVKKFLANSRYKYGHTWDAATQFLRGKLGMSGKLLTGQTRLVYFTGE